MGQAEDAIAYARTQLGKPYRFGALGPDAFDCSGLIVAAYQHANPPMYLPHWTGALIGIGREVLRSELQPGDLVFPDAGHVQLYVGDGQMIEAQQAGVPVRLGPLWGFWRARRIAGSGGSIVNTIGDALKTLPGPFSAAATLTDVVRPIGAVATNAASGNFWKRIGAGVTGAVLIGFGMLWLFRKPLSSGAEGVGRAVGGVGSLAVQGAAFGFGAGRTGGVSAGATSPARVPKPPPAIAPRTSPLPPTSPAYTSSMSGTTTDGLTSVFVGRAKAPARKLPGVQSKPPSKGGKL